MRHLLVLLVLIGLFNPLGAFAQDSLHISGPVKLTLGSSMGTTSAGIGGSVDITARVGQKILQARFFRTIATPFNEPPPANAFFQTRQFTELWETAFTGGLRRELADGWLIGRARTGLAMIFEIKGMARRIRSDDDAHYHSERTLHEISPAIGIPAEAELIFVPIRYVGLGMHVTGNLNRVNSFAGIFFTFRLGHFQ